MSTTVIIRRFLAYLNERWRLVLALYLVMFLGTATLMVIPQVIRWIVDEAIPRRDFSVVLIAVAILFLLALFRAVTAFFVGRWSEIISQGIASLLRHQMFSRLTLMSISLISGLESGQLLQRTMQDVERVRFLTGRAVLRLVESIVLFVGTLVILIGMNSSLGTLALIFMPLLAYRCYKFGSQFRPLSSHLQEQLGNLTTILEQSLRGLRLVKAFAQEKNQISRFDRENEKWFSLTTKMIRLTSVNAPFLDLLANFGMVLVIGAGGFFAINGTLSIGELVAFTAYLSQLYGPVRRFGLVIPAIATAAAAGERLTVVLDAPDGIEEISNALTLKNIRGSISMKGVSYSYGDGRESFASTGGSNNFSHWALQDINLEISAGTTVAILGATGSGKTTLVGLVPRLYDPTEGCVEIDGNDLRQLSVASLRSQIGVVMQDAALFAATIRENIAFGRPDATENEIIEAARAACIHDFVNDLSDQYETMVGERGVTLSGGQRQRIAIARAILVDPSILILDDATSSVDANTEELIHQALERLLAGRTSFIIAQRMSTLRIADLVIVMEKGSITARGNHEDLMKTSAMYTAICNNQLSREITDSAT